MKSVLLSIRPEWCDKIIAGQKTIEIRKTFPDLTLPFKVYIYETKSKNLGGKVIGEFLCDDIFPIRVFDNGSIQDYNRYSMNKSCVPYDAISEYIGRNKVGYGWQISNLLIYDESRALGEFFKYGFIDAKLRSIWHVDDELWKIERPPQSYLFVEDMDEIAEVVYNNERFKPKKSLVDEYNEIKDPAEQLNYYRNLHYKDASDSESYVIAWALDKVLPELARLRKEKQDGK